MGALTPARGPKQPQQERSRATRLKLLEAAVSCLAEHGWSGSTVAVVAERARRLPGRRPAPLPYPRGPVHGGRRTCRGEAPGRRQGGRPQPAGRGSVARTWVIVEELVGLYTGPLFRAALHLWVAASDEDQLRDRVTALEARVGREAHRTAVALLDADEAVAGVRETVQGLLDMARGLGLANLLTDDSARRERVVEQWAKIIDAILCPSSG